MSFIGHCNTTEMQFIAGMACGTKIDKTWLEGCTEQNCETASEE